MFDFTFSQERGQAVSWTRSGKEISDYQNNCKIIFNSFSSLFDTCLQTELSP